MRRTASVADVLRSLAAPKKRMNSLFGSGAGSLVVLLDHQGYGLRRIEQLP